MKRGIRRAIAGLMAIGCWSVASAQQPAATSSPFAPVPTPEFDLGSPKTPKTQPDHASKFKVDRDSKETPAAAPPKGIDLGKSHVEFQAKHSSDVNKEGLPVENGITGNLSTVIPGQRQETVMPNFFGLRLSTPTR
jgi:hypothetical protein